jgi:hypothetical protein
MKNFIKNLMILILLTLTIIYIIIAACCNYIDKPLTLEIIYIPIISLLLLIYIDKK